jgi:hypothetical protein
MLNSKQVGPSIHSSQAIGRSYSQTSSTHFVTKREHPLHRRISSGGYLKLSHITKARITYLPFNGTLLAEELVSFDAITEAQKSAEFVSDGLLTAVIYQLRDDKGQTTGALRTVFLNGRLESILKLNAGAPLNLDSAANVASYLNFYCASVYGESGNFPIIERQEEVHWSEDPDPKLRQAVADQVKPLDIKKDPAGNWSATGTVFHGSELWSITFAIDSSGRVYMSHEKVLVRDLPIVLEKFCWSLRFPVLTATQKSLLWKQRAEKADQEQKAQLAEQEKKQKEQQELAKLQQQQPQNSPVTVDANGISWEQWHKIREYSPGPFNLNPDFIAYRFRTGGKQGDGGSRQHYFQLQWLPQNGYTLDTIHLQNLSCNGTRVLWLGLPVHMVFGDREMHQEWTFEYEDNEPSSRWEWNAWCVDDKGNIITPPPFE